jgi:hypothetical protein
MAYLGYYYHEFMDACEAEDIFLAEQILKEHPDIDVSENCEFLFHTLCKTKKIKIAKWLWNIRPTIDVSAVNDYAFRVACTNQDIEMAQWLLEIKPDINISFNNEETFISACFCNLELTQWLLSVKPEINISAQNNRAFVEACKHLRIDIAKWLLTLNSNIILDIDQKMLFKNIFIGMDMEKIEWFHSISKLDKETYDWAFMYACRWGTLDVVYWVLSKKPYAYYIEKDCTGNHVVNYSIRTEKEARWESRKYALWLSSNITPRKNQILYHVSTDVARLIIGYI